MTTMESYTVVSVQYLSLEVLYLFLQLSVHSDLDESKYQLWVPRVEMDPSATGIKLGFLV